MSGRPHESMPERSAPAVTSASEVEGDKVEGERKSRVAEFELRARSMGITDENVVAQKVAIWEGMWVAKQNGDNIGYDAGILLDAATGATATSANQ
ncbi:hypothetical protein B9Z19DRAFT_1122548 [Tuber borchii]|uniref:Uncharacterized protein n=1 Tax=Tuber borchii TaxID=42251 RepID=A0A2T7A050_TUBBO|nr:hypothetical protein B9Z19DRAFT_1122548 [Tuber borchii]